jgi:hypothetical protein
MVFASSTHDTSISLSKGKIADQIVLNIGAAIAFLAMAIAVYGTKKNPNYFVLLTFFAVPLTFRVVFNSSQRRSLIPTGKSIVHKLYSLRGVNLLLVVYLSVVFLVTFALTLAPPNGADYDSLTYHLAAPAQYLRAGGIVELPYDHHTYFPFTMEMLFLLGLALQGPVLAKLFHWLMLPLCCFALIALGRRHLTTRAGLFGAALFASIPLVQSEATTAYVDLGFTAFVLLAFLCFANWLSSHESEESSSVTNGGWWLAWSGVFCGFAIGTKYLGFLTFGWLGLWALGTMLRRRNFQFKPLLLFAVYAIVLGGGWYVRNWLWTGNPVYPFAYEIFGGRGWTAQMAADYTRDQAAYGFGRSPSDWLWLPWRFAMAPLNIGVLNGQPVGLPLWPFLNVPPNNSMGGKFEVNALLLTSIVGPPLLAFGAPLLFAKRKPSRRFVHRVEFRVFLGVLGRDEPAGAIHFAGAGAAVFALRLGYRKVYESQRRSQMGDGTCTHCMAAFYAVFLISEGIEYSAGDLRSGNAGCLPDAHFLRLSCDTLGFEQYATERPVRSLRRATTFLLAARLLLGR